MLVAALEEEVMAQFAAGANNVDGGGNPQSGFPGHGQVLATSNVAQDSYCDTVMVRVVYHGRSLTVTRAFQHDGRCRGEVAAGAQGWCGLVVS